MPIYVAKISFFRENVVGIGFSELRPGSNERCENSTFYRQFRFLTACMRHAAVQHFSFGQSFTLGHKS